MTAHNGLDVRYQKGNDATADIKNSQSVFVIVISDRLMNARNAIKVVMTPDTPIGQAPKPPLDSS